MTETSVYLTPKEKSLEFRIKEVAKSRGMTLTDVAKTIGKKVSYISRIEKGSINTTINVLQEIADAISVPVHELIKLPKGYGHFYVDEVWQGIRKL